MTKDEIVSDLKEILARDIGYSAWTISTPHLVSLVNKAIEAEREACIAILDELHKARFSEHNYYKFAANAIKELRAKQ